MSILSAFIDRLPSSKRSIRDARNEISRSKEEIADAIEAETALIHSLLEDPESSFVQHIEQKILELDSPIRQRVDSLDHKIDALAAQNAIMQWEFYRRDEEPLENAKKRFFKSMSPATGGMRLFQLGCTQLLQEFDELCKTHGLQYWTTFGTLLGSVRHEGFVPWDDDIDLGMIRSEIETLIEIVDNEPRYRVSVVYDSWNFCKQVRFMYADRNNPCFLDLFIYEPMAIITHTECNTMISCRNKMIDEMRASDYYEHWHRDEFITPDHPVAPKVIEAFDRHRESFLTSCSSDASTRGDAEIGILWGIENIEENAWIPMESDIFPTTTLRFEDIEVQAPANYEKFLYEAYGDIYALPDDIVSHCPHISKEALSDTAVIAAIEKSRDKS